MRPFVTSLIFGLLVASGFAQDEVLDAEGGFDEDIDIFSPYSCPEPNGLFAHHDQCDAYYICEDGKWEGALCEDGYIFDDSKRNHESCKLPHGVECGERVYLQEPMPLEEGRDPKCPRANGIFDHAEDGVCDKFYLCDKGNVHEMPCIPGLVFDNTIGSCVRPEQISEDARHCVVEDKKPEVDGFTCPGGTQLHQGITKAHPVYAHPHDCQFFFSCFNGITPMKFGCGKTLVFDEASKVCKVPEDVKECSCWYECLEDSPCPDSCNADCSCPDEVASKK